MVAFLSQSSQPQTLAQAPIPNADLARKQAMQAAWKAYHGEFQPPLKIAPGQPNDNVISNRCAPIVDKGVSFLFGQVLKIEAADEAVDNDGDDDADDVPTPIQDFLDGLWGDDDDKMTLLSNMGINGGVCGHNFVKLIPAQGEQQYPRIVVMDPMLVRIVTVPDDCSLHLAYIIEYPGTNDMQKRQIIARVDPNSTLDIAGPDDLDSTWTITNYMRKGQAGSWSQTGVSEPWPYPFAPIFCNQNQPNPNEAWGRPDLPPDLIDQNKVLNFVESNTSRIIKFHGHPKTFAVGVTSTQIQMSVDDVICLPSSESKLEMLAPMENFSGLLAFAETIRQNMDELSRVPSVALGRLQELPKGNISGVALALLFQPLVEKTIQKQRLYGKLIREVSRAALVLAGLISVEDYEDYEIDLHWQNLLPVDDLLAAQTAVLWHQLGVSASTLLQGAGFDPDAEADKSANESAQAQANLPPALQQANQQVPGQPVPGQAPPGQQVSMQQGGQQQ